MIRTLAFAALATLAVPTAAAAQAGDNGARFELFGGLDDFDDNLGAENDLFNPETDRDIDAALGATIGYDFVRSGPLRAGVDLEYVYTTAKSAVFVNGVRAGDVKYGSEVYGGGRVTYAITPTISAVGKLGYSYIDTEYTAAVLANSREEGLRGARGALGVQFSTSEEDRTYYGVEARYGNYNRGLTRKSLLLVVGHRF